MKAVKMKDLKMEIEKRISKKLYTIESSDNKLIEDSAIYFNFKGIKYSLEKLETERGEAEEFYLTWNLGEEKIYFMEKQVNQYDLLSRKEEKERNEFKGIFFAFSDNQLKKGMEKLGLKENDFDKIISVGGSGFVLKGKVQEFEKLFSQSGKMEEMLKEESFLVDAFYSELANHEYAVTWDTYDALEALGMENDKLTDFQKKCLMKAKKRYMKLI